MDEKKKEKIVGIVQIVAMAGYVFWLISSTVGKYIKEKKKNIKKEAKRQNKLNKLRYKQEKKKLREEYKKHGHGNAKVKL